MTVREELMGDGRFEVAIHPSTSRVITTEWTGFDWIVITATRFRAPALTYDQVADSALYAGVIHEVARDGSRLAGPSILTRIGDASGIGPHTGASPAPGFTDWDDFITDIFATGSTNELTLGSFFSPPAPVLWDGWQDYEAARTAIDRCRKSVAAEYRVNPDGSFDSGAEGSALFVTDPEILISPLPITQQYDLFTTGIHTPVKVTRDFDKQCYYVHVQGDGIDAYSNFYTGPFTGNRRVSIDWTESSDFASLMDRADWELANTYNTQEQLEVGDSPFYAIGRKLKPGDWLYIWDPFQGLSDTDNPLVYAGAALFPAKLRCLGYTWPIERGMGVYVRPYPYDALIDISDFVTWESGAVQLELSPLQNLTRAIGRN